MSRKKTLVRTLVINAVPQGYVEAVVAATLCSNFIDNSFSLTFYSYQFLKFLLIIDNIFRIMLSPLTV